MTNTTKYYKVTEEELDGGDYNSVIEKLEPNIQKILQEKIELYKFDLLCQIQNTESPIERILILALNDIFGYVKFANRGLDLVGIDAQVDVVCGERSYVADIMIPVYDINKHSGKTFIIECDGHEFHERTKEKVKRDNERNRDFIKQGYTIIHFSGSEIVSDAYKCAREALDIVLNAFKE